MDRQTQVGIHSIGIYLPEQIRTNDWWPEEIVQRWRQRMAKSLVRPDRDDTEPATEGVRRVLMAMEAFRDDPFKGAVERRVMPEGMLSSQMELAAAREAIAHAGIAPSEIDLLLTYGHVPDHLVVCNAPLLHHALGLPERCFSLGVEAGCNSFLQQLALAEQMIRGGQTRYALLVQHSAAMQLVRPEDQHSAWFGDGATAVVVGSVAPGRGILGRSHRTDGSYYHGLLGGVPGKRWHTATERIVLYVDDKKLARKMLLNVCDLARQSVTEALAEAGRAPEEVDFYATHQSSRWYAQATRDYIGLENARIFDSFTSTASLGACNIPFMLAMGGKEGLLRDGDLVALHTGGSGIVFSSFVMCWGR